MEYNYSIFVQPMGLGPELENIKPDILTEDLMHAIGPAMTKINKAIENPPPMMQKPVEIVSHNLVQLGSTLLLSVVVRSPKHDHHPQ